MFEPQMKPMFFGINVVICRTSQGYLSKYSCRCTDAEYVWKSAGSRDMRTNALALAADVALVWSLSRTFPGACSGNCNTSTFIFLCPGRILHQRVSCGELSGAMNVSP